MGAPGSTPTLDCEPRPCDGAASCPPERFERPVCDEILPLSEGPVCRPLCGTLFGCTRGEDCPPFMEEQERECEQIEVGSTGARMGVCVYRGDMVRIDFCENGGGLDVEQVLDCHRRPDGRPTSSWYEGDCDKDGCPNGADPDPCDDRDVASCGSVSLGGPECGPHVPALDGGVRVEQDAGPVVTEMDAGIQVPPGTDFGGGGGFRCATPGRSHGSNAAKLVWLATLGAIAARRRR